jgi:putative tryptophan/tyrosine transport system substrate-binding protein
VINLADRPYDSAEYAGASGPGDSMNIDVRPRTKNTLKRAQIVGLALGAVLFALCDPGRSQTNKIPRIGYLSARDPANDAIRARAILLGLRQLGYINGQNIGFEYRYADGKRARFAELAAELVRLKVDIIVVAGGEALVSEAINATKTIPIVMSGGGEDPVKAGFVQSLARPGGNVTGMTLLVIQLGSKRLELLKEAVPKISRIGFLYESATSGSLLELNQVLPRSARALGLAISPWEVKSPDDFEKVFAALNKQRPDALYVSTSALLNTHQKRIVSYAINSQLPSVYGRKEYVDAGGLMYYGANVSASYQRVAYYVDRILKGAKPADLPIEQPSKFELVINLKTAQEIGVTIPPNVLARADRIIR